MIGFVENVQFAKKAKGIYLIRIVKLLNGEKINCFSECFAHMLNVQSKERIYTKTSLFGFSTTTWKTKKTIRNCGVLENHLFLQPMMQFLEGQDFVYVFSTLPWPLERFSAEIEAHKYYIDQLFG